MAENSKIALRYVKRSANRLGISIEEYLGRRAAGEKWCARCRWWHAVSEFGIDRHNTDGLLPFCRRSTHRLVRKPHRGGNKVGTRLSEATKAKMRAAKLGTANHNWKGGVTPAVRRARQHAKYQAWRRAVIARDLGVCRRCGVTPSTPHAHHVKPFKTHPELALDVSNGLTLCPPCHRQVHAQDDADGL